MNICESCGVEFKPTNKRSRFCTYSCKAITFRKPEQDKIAKANANWLKPKKSNGFSFGKANRQSEWKRVNDDNTWLNRFQGYRA